MKILENDSLLCIVDVEDDFDAVSGYVTVTNEFVSSETNVPVWLTVWITENTVVTVG